MDSHQDIAMRTGRRSSVALVRACAISPPGFRPQVEIAWVRAACPLAPALQAPRLVLAVEVLQY
eukprot:3901486-Amphidinium_carterae.1